ncbi:hypothetical protein HBDW_36080 [Herbaspirillum sp. DW155]|uniref:hypothetical protein n=1 Tax=Herbaspirillum sp. DW155 TaxID=3095609 RepID=UPI00308E1A7A|nr:hypothetical protein HBDW_36080 [Herbaspirillum sp. DW155]
MLKKLVSMPFDSAEMPLGYYVFLMSLISVPLSYLASYLAVSFCTWLGVDTYPLLPHFTWSSQYWLWVACLFGPMIETLLLALGVSVISRFVENSVLVAAISAMVWGVLHGLSAPLRFIGTAWSFYVFSASYIARRGSSFVVAFAAAAVPHMIQNFSVFALR